MFKANTDDVSELTDVVTCYKAKLIDDVDPMMTIKIYPSQKLWVDKSSCKALKVHKTGLITGDVTPYKAESYKFRKVVKAAKQLYRGKVETQLGD